jgi:hypothetical protein
MDTFTTYVAGYSPDQSLVFLYGQAGALTRSPDAGNQKLSFDPGITWDSTGLVYVFAVDQTGALIELRRTPSDQWTKRTAALP